MAEDRTWIKTLQTDELTEGSAKPIPMPDGRTVAVFLWNGKYFATDNQCPHMGFPLVRGTIKNGVLMCDWHGRAFDLVSGGCFHAQCDDLQVFPVKVEDGSVWVEYQLNRSARTDAHLQLLWEGLLGDDRWTMSKALALLLQQGVSDSKIADLILQHMGRHIASAHGPEGGDDVSRLINGIKVGKRYEGEDRLIAYATAARSAAGEAHERSEILPMPPPYNWKRLASWVKDFSRDRQAQRIERCLFTAHEQGDGDKIIPLLYQCIVQPYFLGFSSNLVSLAYMAELVDTFEWESSSELVFYLGANLVGQGRSEPERFRRDAVNRMNEIVPTLEGIDDFDGNSQVNENSLCDALTGVDIVRSFDALEAELKNSTSLDRLITSLVLLAADRMARTPVSVDAGWENLSIELNMASALRMAKQISGDIVAAKGLFHTAFQIFSGRWINLDYRNISEELNLVPAPATTEDAGLEAILDSIQTLNVEEVGDQVLGYLQAGYSGDRLLHQIGKAILRDDTGQLVLPTLRTVFEEWDNCNSGSENLGTNHPSRFQLLVGLARYATDVRSNTDDTSAAFTALRFAEGKTTVEMFEE